MSAGAGARRMYPGVACWRAPVQELIVRDHNTLDRLAIWQTPTGEYLRGKLPESVRAQGHFGVMLRSYLWDASEQDIREFVTKRKISSSTRSDEGRRCRDTFASLKKTCRKLGVSFWEYLTDRVCGKNVIPPLGKLIAQKAQSLGTLADSISLSLA